MNLAAVFIVRVVIRAREWQSQPKGELGLSVSYNVSTQNPKPELTGTQHTDNPLTTQLFPHEWRAHTSPRGVRTISSPQVCVILRSMTGSHINGKPFLVYFIVH